MTDRELLEAILSKISGMEERQTNMEEHMTNMEERQTNMEEHMTSMEKRMTNMEERQSSFENQLKDIKLHLENVTDKNISILAENHLMIIEKLNRTIPSVEKQLLNDVQTNYLLERVSKLEMEVAELKKRIA